MCGGSPLRSERYYHWEGKRLKKKIEATRLIGDASMVHG